VSNCIIYETYGCPIKIGAGRMTLENLSFSNLTLQDVTGAISVNFSGRNRNEDGGADAAPAAFVRNLSFSNIRASVVAEPTMSYKDMGPSVHPFPGEQHSCITLNGLGDAWIENVTFDDVHVTYAGGGTAELAAKRNIPQTSREYFGVWGEGPVGPPAYGLFARNVIRADTAQCALHRRQPRHASGCRTGKCAGCRDLRLERARQSSG
jgi:hypothetical protein